MIPQFSLAEIHCCADAVQSPAPETLGMLVFNMERGVYLDEIGDFLQTCQRVQPWDVILANEMDDGCVRSGGRDTATELARRLGMNCVFALEFIELVDQNDPKGYHGNAIFTRWPVKKARVLRLPEQYNWYFDRQRRIGGRNAILAQLDIDGRSVGVVSAHLENRTHGEGRRLQMEAVLDAVESYLPDMPVIIGGDFNTNTFDGRDTDAIREIAGSAELRRRCLEDVASWEGLLPLAESRGYRVAPGAGDLDGARSGLATRRKPLPGGGDLELRLDWLLLRGASAAESRIVSTRRANCGFAPEGSALARFSGEELSDHNAVWAACRIDDPQ